LKSTVIAYWVEIQQNTKRQGGKFTEIGSWAKGDEQLSTEIQNLIRSSINTKSKYSKNWTSAIVLKSNEAKKIEIFNEWIMMKSMILWQILKHLLWSECWYHFNFIWYIINSKFKIFLVIFSHFGHVAKLAKYNLTVYYYWYYFFSSIAHNKIIFINSISYGWLF